MITPERLDMPATAISGGSPSNCLMITPPMMALHQIFHRKLHMNSSKRCTMLSLGTLPNQHGCRHLQPPSPRQSLTVMRSEKMRCPGPSNTLSHLLPPPHLTKSAISFSRDVQPFSLLSWTSSILAGHSQLSQPSGRWQPSS